MKKRLRSPRLTFSRIVFVFIVQTIASAVLSHYHASTLLWIVVVLPIGFFASMLWDFRPITKWRENLGLRLIGPYSWHDSLPTIEGDVRYAQKDIEVASLYLRDALRKTKHGNVYLSRAECYLSAAKEALKDYLSSEDES